MQHRSNPMRTRSIAVTMAAVSSACVFMAMPESVAGQTATAPATAAAALPDGRVLMAQFNKAIGGADAFAKLQSIHMVGTMNMGPMPVQFESFSARPNKSVTLISANGMELRQGFDGTVGWMMNPMAGPTLLEGDMLAAAKDGADFESMLRDTARYKTIQTIEKSTLDGKECYKVRVVNLKDVESFDCYAVDSHLLIATLAATPEVGETYTFLRDYRAFGGVMFPTQMIMSAPMGQQEMTMTKIEVNTVDAGKFALPAEIQALIKK